MRRENKQQGGSVVVPTPVHWFPYTSDGNDIIGSLTPASGSPTYGANGAVFTGGSLQKLRYDNVPLSDFKTIALDVYFTTLGGLRKLITFFRSNTQQYGIICGWDWNVVQYQFWNGSSTQYNFNDPKSNYSMNTWYRIVMRISGNNTDVFINGEYINSVGVAYTQNVNHTMYVGGRETSGREFYGNVRDYKMWDVALTNEQIAAL